MTRGYLKGLIEIFTSNVTRYKRKGELEESKKNYE